MKEHVSFVSHNHKLMGTLYKAADEKAAALLIAGGANTPRNEGYYPPLQEEFLKKGITTFNFDFTGVGESEGEISMTNLNTRLEDATEALKFLKQNITTNNIYIIGVSMGAPIAIRLTSPSIKGLALVVPAAYSEDARNKNFGPEFSVAIRKIDSWKDSPDFKELETYSGKLFLLYADNDEVIPQEILKTYEKIVNSKFGNTCILKDADHRSWKNEQSSFAFAQLLDFVA